MLKRRLTIAGSFRRSECACVCMSCNPCGSWCDCVAKDLRHGQPLYLLVANVLVWLLLAIVGGVIYMVTVFEIAVRGR